MFLAIVIKRHDRISRPDIVQVNLKALAKITEEKFENYLYKKAKKKVNIFDLPWVFAWLEIMSRVHSHKIPRKTGNILYYVPEQCS